MITNIIPATPIQQGFLLGAMSARKDQGSYVEQIIVNLRGPIDVERFSNTWKKIVARHEILQTGFSFRSAGAPQQVLVSNATLPFDFFDISNQAGYDPNALVKELLDAHRREGFDFRKPPLMRITLVKISSDQHRMIWTHHHAILDGWSQSRLLNEFAQMWSGVTLSAPICGFNDFVRRRAPRAQEVDAAYWKNLLTDCTHLATINHQVEDIDLDEYAVIERRVSALATTQAIRYAREHSLTIAALLTSIWSMAIGRWCERDDFVIGVTVAGRPEDILGSEDVVGPLAYTIPVRCRFEREQSFQESSRSTQLQVGTSAGHSAASAAEIRAWLGIDAFGPLYDAVIAVANYPPAAATSSTVEASFNLNIEEQEGFGGRTLLPLTMVAIVEEAINLRLTYRSGLIAKKTAEWIVEAVESQIALVGDQPSTLFVEEVLAHIGRPEKASIEVEPVRYGLHPAEVEETVLRSVCTIFSRLLKREHVDPERSFLQLGGHSLLALQLLRTIADELSVNLTLHDLLECSTPALLATLIRDRRGITPTAVVPHTKKDTDSIEDGKPYPLSEIQEAYWLGRQEAFELGNVDSNLYAEVETADLDIARLEACWNKLIARHAMLRTVITEDGMQTTLGAAPWYEITQYSSESSVALEELVASARDRLASPRRDGLRWPLFDIEVIKMGNDRLRWILSFDLLIGDAHSWWILYRDLVDLYTNPAAELPTLTLQFGEYLERLKQESVESYSIALNYWRARLPTLPEGPALPKGSSDDYAQGEFTRREFRLPPNMVRRLRNLAAELGVTPSIILLATFSMVIGQHSNTSHFLINVTVFNRLPIHEQVNEVVGPFTSLSLMEVDLRPDSTSFRSIVLALQSRMWHDLDHRAYSGLKVLRDLACSRNTFGRALAPIVFTSTLEGLEDPASENADWHLVYGIGKTPQVSIDYQTFQIGKTIAVIWDSVDAAFATHLVDDMFAEHKHLLEGVIEHGFEFVDSHKTLLRKKQQD